MATGAYRTAKGSKQAAKPNVDAESTIWPPPPRRPDGEAGVNPSGMRIETEGLD